MPTEGYLLDTSVASWLWDGGNRNHASARLRITALGDALIFVCPITIGEVACGLAVSPAMDAARHSLVRGAMAEYEVLTMDPHTGETYGQIRAAVFAQHSPRNSRGRMQKKVPEDLIEPTTGKTLGIQENDLWLVSVAVQYNLRLITSDEAEGMRRVLIAASYLQRVEFWVPNPVPDKDC
jgi:predicted nucleic acid-binding protein